MCGCWEEWKTDFLACGTVLWKMALASIKFSMYWPNTRFSDLSFKFSSFTVSTRRDRSDQQYTRSTSNTPRTRRLSQPTQSYWHVYPCSHLHWTDILTSRTMHAEWLTCVYVNQSHVDSSQSIAFRARTDTYTVTHRERYTATDRQTSLIT